MVQKSASLSITYNSSKSLFFLLKNTKEAKREVPILRVDEETFTNLREYLPTITSLYPKLTHNIYATYIYIYPGKNAFFLCLFLRE